MVDYSRWETLEDSDDERQREKDLERRREQGRLEEVRKATRKTAAPSTQEALPEGMQNFMKAMSCGQYGGGSKYKLPTTLEDKQERARAAEDLKSRGNQLYAAGEHFEAAKLYEQAVLKFDWYLDSCADDEERAIVLPVKIPCHLNLAMMSMSLGNFEHAVVHCSQAIKHDESCVKALFRRGVCYTHLGDLRDGREDLERARELEPRDPGILEALAKLKVRACVRSQERTVPCVPVLRCPRHAAD